MKQHRKIFAAVLIVLLAGALLYIGYRSIKNQEGEDILPSITGKTTINLWYTDDALTDYLNSAAVTYSEETDIRVLPKLVSGLEYMEQIYDASVAGEEVPDVYITTNDTLAKAYLAGLAEEIDSELTICDTSNYPKPALEAVAYHDKIVGFPMYYETSVLLYNRTYMEDFVKSDILSEQENSDEALNEEELVLEDAVDEDAQTDEDVQTDEDAQTGEDVQADGENEEDMLQVSEAEMTEKIEVAIPSTIEDILTFADAYDAPETVEAVFKWDVTDIFYNYFVAGNYIKVGGFAGDDLENIDIYNKEAIACLKAYQDLNQFFSIDTEEISYEGVIQEFIEGKLVFTVATTDAIAKVEEAIAEGNFNYEYGITVLPDVNDTLTSKSLSVTNALVINGFSEHKEEANAFASYLLTNDTENFYPKTGKLSAQLHVAYENENALNAMREYERSVPIPKMLSTSNFWVQLEASFAKIWNGEDVNETLRALSETIMTQVTGEEYHEEVIIEEEELAGEEGETMTEEEAIAEALEN